MTYVLKHSQPAGEPIVARREDRFDFLDASYRDLHAGSAATAFQHPLWLDAFYRIVAPARGAEPVIIVGRLADGRPVLVLPMIRRKISGVLLLEAADLGVSDYAAPVVSNALAQGTEARTAILAALPDHDILRVRPVREEHVAAWQSLVGREARRLEFSAHAAEPGLPYEKWRSENFDASFQKYLDRRVRRFFKSEGASFGPIGSAAEAGRLVAEIRRLRAGRFSGDPIAEDHAARFYCEIAERGIGEDFARCYALHLDGRLVGAVFGLTHAGRYHYLLIGCDYEAFGKLSPGLVLYDRMMEDWALQGGSAFDFTIGDEPFKADFATRPTAMFSIGATPSIKGRMATLAFEARERLGGLKKQREGNR